MPRPIAILCSDIHLSHKAPPVRAGEPDWYEAMARPLAEMVQMARSMQLPVLCAGDLFDKWNSPPELVNFALASLKPLKGDFYCVPGQHDLPYHSYGEMRKSAYWTMCSARAVYCLNMFGRVCINESHDVWVHGFGWNEELSSYQCSREDMNIAVIHKYVWNYVEDKHPGAEMDSNVSNLSGKMGKFDVVLSGDNHKRWQSGNWLNPGTFMTRRKEDIGQDPAIGVLQSDGTIDLHYLDTRHDVIEVPEEPPQVEGRDVSVEALEFVSELDGLVHDSVDFMASLQGMTEGEFSAAVRKVVLDILEEAKNEQK